MKISGGTRIVLLGLITLVAFPLLGAGIFYFASAKPVSYIFRSFEPVWLQLLLGLLSGIALGSAAVGVIMLPFMKQVRNKYQPLLAGLKLNLWQIIFVSFCAGFGEEILFRGSIQPLTGIWITAIIFVAVHGYLNPKDWKLSIYGIFMTLAIALLGYLTETYGILTAAVAHTFIDIVLFLFLGKTKSPEKAPASA